MRVTIKDIASKANVSKSTVSKVLNNDPSIPEKTKKHIRSIMNELNYIPNQMARNLATRNAKTVGLIINTTREQDYFNPYFYDLIGGVEKVCAQKNYELVIASINHNDLSEDFLSKYVYNKRLSGLIFPSSVLTDEIYKDLVKLKFPCVVIGKDKKYRDLSSVDIDNAFGCELALNHLIEKGHKNIAFLGGSPSEPIEASRQIEYKRFIHETHNFQPLVMTGGHKEEDGYDLAKELVEKHKHIDAILTVNNFVAFGALKAFKEMGIRVPSDIAIVTFDNQPLSPYTTPSLTAILNNTFELGQIAALTIFQKIDTKDHTSSVNLISPSLIERESSGS